ncbi:ATP-dependent DNA helicase PIF1 [Colletotrichum fioriniae PJ7]|uniref:ATP-dependent DNA helicase n=1 Tax=Colletotrichum fioriniae PJ7 TaxID=1445577 RepID=A0A010RT82_9PEZI|nr:ATP-dependent DNA helicase PIF1 [Colletotrichum fioriniae PJ7]
MAFKQTQLQFGPKRKQNGTLSAPSPKRSRSQPEPDDINSTGHGDAGNEFEASSSSKAETDAGPSDNLPQTAEFNEPVPDPLEPPLGIEQQEAMNLAMAGHNLFITGSGGCGKSVLVKALQTNFEAKHKYVHLIAPTGLAALNINGRTAFNYAGWVPDDKKKTFGAIVAKSKGEIFD